MTTLSNNYYGTAGQLGAYPGGNGGNGSYALNIGGAKTGGGHYLPPGTYVTGASVEIRGGSGGSGNFGPYGGNGGGGGAGVTLSSGTLTNGGSIIGGVGGYGSYGGLSSGSGGSGGVGVALMSGTLTNTGIINGGVGGYASVGSQFAAHGGDGGDGGAGVTVSSGTLTNHGSIHGGAGYVGSYGGYVTVDGGSGGVGGVGVILSSGTLTNQGIITGGAGGNGGPAIAAASGAGGAGGAGIYMQGGALTNSNTIIGGSGGASGGRFTEYNVGAGAGGAGVALSSGTLSNSGSITGGAGGVGFNGSPYGIVGGGGGAGLTLSSGTAINHGHIAGGAGGNGANGYYSGGSGGAGGAGVTLSSGTLTNSGSITGSAGGNGGYGANIPAYSLYGVGGAGGNGGAGAFLNGGTLMSSGTISGGAGGTGGYGSDNSAGGAGGNGGAGVYLNGGTLMTSGTISGGDGGTGGIGKSGGVYTYAANGAAGDAVQFGSMASTLIVKPGAVFHGQVAANASVNDVLKLSGVQSGGTPIALGTQFTDFSTLTFAARAAWTVDVGTGAAPSGGLAIGGFTSSDTIDVTNLTPTQVAGEFNPTNHTLTTVSDGTLHLTGAFSDEYFTFTSDGGTGTDIALAAGSGISTTLLSGVILGSAAHPSPLTITTTGVIAPEADGATGVLSDISGNVLTNNGAVDGGGGGGLGLKVEMAATLTNNGSITGGAGESGAGGTGADLLAGTLTNTGSLAGGAGASNNQALPGGAGGAGAVLNGGTLITSGTISGGPGGTGSSNGAMGDAVKFGTTVSTLVVDPGAVFNGQVVANAAVNDMLELSGTQSGGTAITLGTQFTDFSTLKFASGASGTVDATKVDLTEHMLSIDGFAIGDTLDITNLVKAGTTSSFSTTTDVLKLTHGATVINLQFDSAFTGDHFVLTAAGSGTDLTLAPGAHATLASLGHDVLNFVSDFHRGLTDGRIMSMHGLEPGLPPAANAADQDFASYGLTSRASIDHGIAHTVIGMCKA